MTERIKLSPAERETLYYAARGICHLCNGPISIGESWDISHPIPLAMGGKDDDSNRAPAHRKCHREQTARIDIPTIAKSKRIQRRHLGIVREGMTRNRLPGGRDDRLKKKMNGRVVERQSVRDQMIAAGIIPLAECTDDEASVHYGL